MTPLEINKRIAELKGWDVGWDDGDSAVYDKRAGEEHEGEMCFSFYDWARGIYWAWELFEEMAEDGWIIGRSPDGWFVGKIKPGEIYPTYDITPMAICMAWIKWKEGK